MPRKKIAAEVILSVLAVLLPTWFFYSRLSGIPSFWNAQFFWNAILAVGWIVVSSGYYHQGWLVHKRKNADEVSIVLPTAVFFVQCILFVKGIFYEDWALVFGALIVNSGVLFSLYQIIRARRG